MATSITLNHGRRLAGVAGCLGSAALILGGCLAGPAASAPATEDDSSVNLSSTSFTPLDRPSGTKLRVASWNTDRGSVFPYSDSQWKEINTGPSWRDQHRVDGAARIFKGVDADIWLLQETMYGASVPSDLTTLVGKIRTYMNSIVPGSNWHVDCNGASLCTMFRMDRGISFVSSCDSSTHYNRARYHGDLVKVGNNTPLVLANVHYTSDGQASDTHDMITNSKAAAYIVAGDFNGDTNQVNPSRYSDIDSVNGMTPVNMYQKVDPGASQVSSGWKSSMNVGTDGTTAFGDSSSSSSVVKDVSSQWDHFFTSSKWQVKNSLVLNTLLFSPGTLNRYGLLPLDVVTSPSTYWSYFSGFMSTGKIVPTLAKDGHGNMGHDHLPMIVDLSFTDEAVSSPTVYCPQ